MKNFWLLIIVVSQLLFLTVVFNYYSDPLHFFHPTTSEFEGHAHDRYSLAGKLKSSKYDNIVIGSSHSVHFSGDVLSKVSDGKWLNAAVAGSTAYEQYLFFSLAHKSQKLNTVIWELRLDAYVGDPERTRLGRAFPTEYYQDTIQGKLKYLLSLDTFIAAVNKDSPQTVKEDKYTYGKNMVAEVLQKYCKNPPLNGHRVGILDAPYSLKNNLLHTLEKAIKQVPDVSFKVFFPPYSILNHAYLKKFNIEEYDEYLSFRNIVIETLRTYPNVQIYDFQTDAKTITDMKHYRDLRHYDTYVYSIISERLALPVANQPMAEEYFLEKINQLMEEFDYSGYESCLTS